MIGDEEIQAVADTLRSGWLTSGPRVRELEQRFAEYAGATHAIATSSCTEALHLSLVAAGVGDGDEVVTSSFTWPATVNAIVHAGATPVFADVDAGSLNLDPDASAAAVTERTRAVIPVHIAGGPCDMDAIEAVTRAHGITIVEDAAHAVETTVGKRKVGSIGDFTCFSLYATKSLAGGEGGIATTGSDEAAATMRLLRAQGITRDPWQRVQNRSLGHYDVVRPGYKANLADLQAAMALPKLDRIGELHARRTALVERYDAGIAGLAGIAPIARPPIGVHAHHLYIVRIDPDVAGGDRDRYAEALMAENIATGLHFLPVHQLTWYREHLPAFELPATERAGSEVLSLPLSAAHDEGDIDDALGALASSTPRSRDEPADTRRRWRPGVARPAGRAALVQRPDEHLGHPGRRRRLVGAGGDRREPGDRAGDGLAVAAAARAKRVFMPIGWLTRTYFVSLFAGQFLPAAIGGDAVRAVELGRRTEDAPEAVASVLIDRLVGVVSLVVLALIAFTLGGHRRAAPRWCGGGRVRAAAVLILACSSPPACAAWPRGSSSRASRAASSRPASASTTRSTATASTAPCWPPCSCWR